MSGKYRTDLQARSPTRRPQQHFTDVGPGSNSIKMSTGLGGTQQVQQPLKFRATAIICAQDEAKGSLPVSGKLILPCHLKWTIVIPEVAAAGRFLLAPRLRFPIESVG